MQSECPIHTNLKYFSFLSFQNCSLRCVWIHFIPTRSLFMKTLFFLFGFPFTHAHTKVYDHAPQKHLINIQAMPLSPQSTTFRGGLFSQGLWPMYISRLEGSHNHLWEKLNTSTPPGKAILSVPLGHMARIINRSFPLGIDLTVNTVAQLPGTQTENTTHTHQLKTTARSRLLENLFKAFNPINFKISFSPL